TNSVDAGERHLVALWAAVRDAHALLRRGGLETYLQEPSLAGLLKSLAKDLRLLSDALNARLRPAPRVVEAVRHPGEKPRVLAIDDSALTLAELQRQLGDDFEIIATHQPTQGVKLAHEQPCDAVIADLRMPGVDGLALLDLL